MVRILEWLLTIEEAFYSQCNLIRSYNSAFVFKHVVVSRTLTNYNVWKISRDKNVRTNIKHSFKKYSFDIPVLSYKLSTQSSMEFSVD